MKTRVSLGAAESFAVMNTLCDCPAVYARHRTLAGLRAASTAIRARVPSVSSTAAPSLEDADAGSQKTQSVTAALLL